jgi:hypothetical protein
LQRHEFETRRPVAAAFEQRDAPPGRSPAGRVSSSSPSLHRDSRSISAVENTPGALPHLVHRAPRPVDVAMAVDVEEF